VPEDRENEVNSLLDALGINVEDEDGGQDQGDLDANRDPVPDKSIAAVSVPRSSKMDTDMAIDKLTKGESIESVMNNLVK
jgi:hypothetical protein